MKSSADQPADLSAVIADDIRAAIVSGELGADQRLPSETELAEHFSVSRPTVREALKRLAAQSLIRTQRGAFGGAFVRKLSFEDAYETQVTTAALLITMNAVRFDVACEARFALERACVSLAAARRKDAHLEQMRQQIKVQQSPDLSDEEFCASDVAFHRALVDAADNPLLSFQLAGAVEGMQPLMNMITFSARSRARIIELHTALADALEANDAHTADTHLAVLENYTRELAEHVAALRAEARANDAEA